MGELTQIWEKEWGILHASRLRFVAAPESEQKWLNFREDVVPMSPVVTRLEGLSNVLQTLANTLRQRVADPAAYDSKSSRNQPLFSVREARRKEEERRAAERRRREARMQREPPSNEEYRSPLYGS